MNKHRHARIRSAAWVLVASGGRSLLAAKLAQDMGVTNAVSLDGGFTAWAKANGPISK